MHFARWVNGVRLISKYMDFIRLLFRIYNILLWSEWTYSYQFFWYSREVLGNQIIFYLFTDGIMTITQNKKWNRLFQLMNNKFALGLSMLTVKWGIVIFSYRIPVTHWVRRTINVIHFHFQHFKLNWRPIWNWSSS